MPTIPALANQKIAITATFTSEPVEDSLSYWLKAMGFSDSIEFAQYNQVFQELLNPSSLLATNHNGVNVILVRFEDWQGTENRLQPIPKNAIKAEFFQNENSMARELGENITQIEQTVHDFANALKTATTRSPNSYLVCICPPSPTYEKAFNGLHEKLQEQLEIQLQKNTSICLIKSQELLKTYPVQEYYDPYGDELGHIPYHPTFFIALGTILARKILALKSSPYKVIALDCDNTLWNGICGEDGVEGVKINAPFQALQEFIIAQQTTGKLICLCSKNQPDEVFAVFEQHPDMLLKRNHLVNWRINWQEKSQNLQSLAEELQLGLDSFIFIDDNPIECAEVRANCPEVLTLQLPQESEKIPQFLDHIWAFDQLQTTQEDQQRTNLYQQNIQRQRLQEDSLSFEDFLAQLNLEIEISPIQTEELTRVAQLTQRTNQFNLTTIRRSEPQIKQLCSSGELDCRGVKVKDRFGDYGLVGLLLFNAQEDSLIVDTFLLSCRVLGRGVEHKMLAYLGTIAQEKRLATVELFYKPTPKNKPIWDFLTGIQKGLLQEKKDGVLFEFSAQIASETIFSPRSNLDSLEQKTKISLGETTAKSDSLSYRILNYQFFENIAQNLYNPELILQEIACQQQRQRQLDGEFVAPRTPLEKAIASLFAEVLKLDRVGIDDDFFELGGDSIRGAILINKLQAQLSEIIHFVVLFDQKTVRGLSAYLEEHYPKAIAKILGKAITEINDLSQERIDEAKVLQMRSLIPGLTSTVDDERDENSKNPPAIFILSPYRSGSTLLRVILGGNPQLFAPPELELLGFNTLGERKAQFSGRYNFWMEGTIRTIMEIKGCNAEEAIAIMEELEEKNLTSKQFYRLLQEWLGDKILIDKTPSYSLDLETLKRAEINFHNPLYIHLVRHPLGMIHSYEEAKIDQIFPYQNSFNSRELAELVWLISHQNILEFLQQVSPQRQYQVKFEDIVKQPQKTIESLCQFLGVEFNPDMLQPYKEKKQRMTDGIYAESRMIGDVKFHKHQSINPNTIDQWKDYYNTDFLGNVTWQLAESFKYPSNNHNIPQVSRENPTESQTFPVSFAQQRLWILAQLEPDSPFYNMFKAVHLQGPVNIEILERSLNEIIHRHEILRTNFQEVEATPVQVIAPHATLKISVIDLQGLSEQEQSEQLQLLATEDQLQPFDLTTGILLRVTLVQLKSESSALLLTMHHIISDGWSMGVLLKELSSLYQGFLLGHGSILPKLPIQYADFTIWQRQWLQGENQGFITIQNQINYWKQQLAAAPPLLELPTDRPRPSVQTFRGGCLSFQIDERLTASLKELSHKSATTLFMTLMAGYVTLLFRHSDQNDILVGTPIASRNYQELEGLIGFFVNTLVMRTRLEGNPSFEELLKQVRSVCTNSYANQDVPFEQIIETLQIERSLSHSPLFQVMFVLQNVAMEELETPGLKISPLSLDNVNAKFDFALQMWEINTEKGNSLQGFWQYNLDLFDQDRIARMSSHFQTLLEAIVANPQESIGTLSLLTERERHQLLVEWNDTDTAYPDKKCIHQLFEEQVERTPNHVAVVFENESLTYRELNNRANQLAHYLQELGVKPDTLVGICVERSLEMIVGILGILKAGGAYVPLDPEYPQQRLSFMLEDTQVKVLLTQEHLVEQLPKYEANLLMLEKICEKIEQNSPDNLSNALTPFNLANVIYTSGTTGKPKGVMVEHKGLCNLAQAQIQAFGVNNSSHVLQFASFSFDACIWEILMSLGAGATLYLGTKEGIMPGEPLIERLRNDKITCITLPPSALAVLPGEELPQLQTIIVAGETCSPELMKQWSIGRNFFNAYGPTESSVCATIAKCQSEQEKLSIGRPIPNTKIYILDSQLQPVPIGVPGELHIGGAGLARGYLNRPELTQEKFIPNPFDKAGVSKLYKTGDLARYLPDGNIEYLGRIDNQVKIRGFRIELGEIETVLTQNPQVQSSVIIARENTPGNKRLVGYIVPQKEATPTSNELRQYLKGKLPDYMIPHVFVILESLPLTPNGKIDRRALPAPESSSELLGKYVAPRTFIEDTLATIWAQVLRVKEVGIDDNFFELGGDSILSISIIARAKQAGLQLIVKQLFAHQTIAELAAVTGTSKEIQIDQGLVRGETPLTPIQHWFFEQNLCQSYHFNQSYLLSVPSSFQSEYLEPIWQELFKHHDALRLRFTQSGDNWQAIYSTSTDRISVNFIDLSTLSDNEQKTAIATKVESLQGSLNLSKNLVQIAFFDLGVNKRARLLIIIHHLVVDGVSWRILLEDLQTAYQQLIQGQKIKLPPKTTSFKDWSQHLIEYAQSDLLKAELAYWSRASHTLISPIPIDYSGGANTVKSISTISVSLNETQTQLLLQNVPKAYQTQINDVLLTALVLVWSKWTNADSVLFNLEGHGREEIIEDVDLSRTVGWFTTMFPVILKLETIDKENLGNALKSVKEQLRAIPHKGIGYGLLRYLRRDQEIVTQLAAFSQAEISFNYLGQFSQVLNQNSLIQLASESSGLDHSLEGQRPHLLNINAIVINEQLQIDWKYSTHVHKSTTIEKIAQDFVEVLQELIAHCTSPDNGGYTPTDFPLLEFSQTELDKLLANL
jgi:amino acid adenylation domain-containing protein/FkbH-like protein/non-ribosomal peptide synthase protein (TIGR01720 family)